MAMDWRSLPPVIVSVKSDTESSPEDTQSSDSNEDVDKAMHDTHDDDDILSISASSSESNEEPEDQEDEHLADEELRRKIRRTKHLAKIREVYADYLSDGSTTTNSTNNESHDTNLLQTVRYRPPRRTRGCPHWRMGCKFEGDEAALKDHIQHDCCFEKMKGMIKKRDHQIDCLQNSCAQLQHQVTQLHSLLSSFVSLQAPQLQSYLMSHLPNDVSGRDGLHLTRNLSSELYDASHNAINLSLHSLDDSTRPLAYQRREVNREMIHKHEMSIGGRLALIWRSVETLLDTNNSSVLNPTVNYVNNEDVNRLTLSSYNESINAINGNDTNHLNNKKLKQDIAVRSMILFWNKVISTSDVGIQIWDILSDDDSKQSDFIPKFGSRSTHTNAKIQGLSHNGWLFNESSFGLATQPFSHPYWLFTGHKQQIRVWKYNGFSFNTSCNCAACHFMFPSQGYGDVRCIAVSSDHIFASSDSNIIQFWKFTETETNTNLEEASMHSVGSSTLDKRIHAVGNIEYLGNLVCGHRGMITSLKVFGDVLISGSKDGFITIWSATQLVNLSILHYGSNPVLDFTIFPNPYPLCHMTIWNDILSQHLKALQNNTRKHHMKNTSASSWSETQTQTHDNDDMNKSVIQYVSLNSLYDEIPKKEKHTIQDTILGYCGSHTDTTDTNDTDDMLNNGDAPEVLASVFRAAIPSSLSTGSSSSQSNKQKQKKSKINKHREMKHKRVLSREIMHRASSHFASIARIIQDLKLIVGGRSGEIHIWHIGTKRDVYNSTTTWERESILRGHGDSVTCLASFGTRLLSAYSNGSIKLWKWDKSDFLCTGTAYMDEKRLGSADTSYGNNDDSVNFNKRNNSYNSVRSVLLLPSPTLNLNEKLMIEDNNRMVWSSFDEDDFDEHDDDDEMELNCNEFDVKISANHDDKTRKRKGKKRKKHKHRRNINKHKMNNKDFWVLSGTTNGSMLLHEMDYL